MASNALENLSDKVKANTNIVKRGLSYGDGFIKAFSSLDPDYIDRKIFTYNDSKQESQYLQGLAEVIFYKYFMKCGFLPKTDVVVNDTAKDVDLVIEKDNIRINIEVKCPIISEEDSSTLYMSTGHRYSNNKEEHKQIFDSVIEQMKENFKNNPNKTYSSIEYEKLDDNKLKDYLESAQSKFSIPKLNECNVLILALTTRDLIRFFDYIVNSQTGIFSGNSYIDPDHFDKVDCIILTNIISGHYKYDIGIDIWDASKYISFVLPNLNKHKNKEYVIPNESEKVLIGLFGNLVYNFKKFEEEFYNLNPDFPRAIQLTLPTYIARDFNVFSKEYKGEDLPLLK